jgi:hypothetical protein
LEFLAIDIADFIGGGWIRAGDGKVVNLAAKKDGFSAKVVRNVNIFLVGYGFKTKFGGSQNVIDMGFPDMSTFWIWP